MHKFVVTPLDPIHLDGVYHQLAAAGESRQKKNGILLISIDQVEENLVSEREETWQIPVS